MPRREPRYMVVKNTLLRRIRKGQYPPGGKMPPLRELAESFSVNYGTAAKAVRLLAEEGLVSSEVGRGTFVVRARTVPDEHGKIALGFQETFFNDSFSHAVVPFVITGLKRVFSQQYWDLVMLSHPAARLGSEILSILHGRKYRGLVLYNTPRNVEDVEALARAQIPSVCIGEPQCPMGPVPRVSVDRVGVYRQSLQRLAELGHRRIGCAVFTVSAVTPQLLDWRRRIGGDCGFVTDDGLVAWVDNDGLDVDYAPLFQMLERERPTAVLVPDEVMANQVFSWCFRNGLRVPEDLSLVAISDLTPHMHPVPLSAINGAVAAVGLAELAGRTLMTLMDGDREAAPTETVVVRDILWKESVAQPADRSVQAGVCGA